MKAHLLVILALILISPNMALSVTAKQRIEKNKKEGLWGVDPYGVQRKLKMT